MGADDITDPRQNPDEQSVTRPATRVVVVDDEPVVCRSLQKVLLRNGYQVDAFNDPLEALAHIEAQDVDMLLCDVCMPEMNGLELLKRFKQIHPLSPALMLTGSPDTLAAVDAMNLGATHYLIKPVHPKELLLLVDRTLDAAQAQAENQRLREQLHGDAAGVPLLWRSDAMRAVMEHAGRLADLDDATVLLLGENGTGKELLAHHLHRQSKRASGPFIPVNCGAIPRELIESEFFGHKKGAFTGAHADHAGLFSDASSGTLFLDEVGELPLDMQVKLLRAIEAGEIRPVGDTHSRRVDVRILAATNRDLEGMVAAGRFRQDLYYRLSVFRLELPPLRVRRDDIPLLARFFLREAAARFNRPVRGFTDDALAQLRAHRWPGNVRELLNEVQRAVVLVGAGLIDAVHLNLGDNAGTSFASLSAPAAEFVPDPDHLDLKAATEASRIKVERQYIQLALEHSAGNRTRAAKLLGISYRALMYKLKEYEL